MFLSHTRQILSLSPGNEATMAQMGKNSRFKITEDGDKEDAVSAWRKLQSRAGCPNGNQTIPKTNFLLGYEIHA
jgi:hypothetical protein